MNRHLSPEQDRKMRDLCRLLELVMLSQQPGYVTLHHDGNGNFAYGKVEVTAVLDLAKFAAGKEGLPQRG